MFIWSVAVYDFKLREEDFWRLTPAKFASLSRRFDAKMEIEDFRMGNIMALIANVYRSEKSKAYTWKDFVPREYDEKTEEVTANDLHTQWKTMILPQFNVIDKKGSKNG